MDIKSLIRKRCYPLWSLGVSIYKRYLMLRKYLYKKTKRSEYGAKVFCIGYNKTGTTSLGRSLRMLGYNHSSYDHTVYRQYYVRDYDIAKIIEYTSKYESFDDLPWLMTDMIPILDKTFPGSKFIYLERDEESWKSSWHKWYFTKFGKYPATEKYLDRYRNHRDFVMDYFKDRMEKDLIILSIKDADGFERLARFLGKKAPMKGFPHHNQTKKIKPKPLSRRRVPVNSRKASKV